MLMMEELKEGDSPRPGGSFFVPKTWRQPAGNNSRLGAFVVSTERRIAMKSQTKHHSRIRHPTGVKKKTIARKTPKCPERLFDCFAYKKGFCRCLSNTDFGGRSCPFFQNAMEISYGLIEAEIEQYRQIHGWR